MLLERVEGSQSVVLPVVKGALDPLEWRLWTPGAQLVPAGFGSLAPEAGALLCEPDIVMMPLLGFDRWGTRLGYGGGYYDRSIAALRQRPLLVGLAFAIQEFDSIPRQDHDIALDAVVTEAGLRYFGSP